MFDGFTKEAENAKQLKAKWDSEHPRVPNVTKDASQA